MNAPLPEHIRQALESVRIDDKYTLEHGHAFMSGVQALVKLPMLQRLRDQAQGKNTAGFISGYRGSPLGGYDQALWQAAEHLKAQNIVFQPGVNEELAATALWGTQQLGFAPPGTNKFDGVFGIWYGKGPGVDRCSDVFKHATMAGTTPWGGVLAVAGDDHLAKSSTAAHQSDHIFMACGLPLFFPTSVQEILDLGLHALAMSRFSGVWAGMKTIQEIVESNATVMVDPDRVQIKLPTDFQMPVGGVHIRWPDTALEQEERLFTLKWAAAKAYIRANRLNHNVIEGANDRFGLMASGKAYNDTRQALIDLGLDDATCRQLGIRLHKVAVVWPLQVELTHEFASGLQEILVLEEKRPVLELQLKEQLYPWRAEQRPQIFGKLDDSGQALLRSHADLTPGLIARAIAQRLKQSGILQGAGSELQAKVDTHLAMLAAKEQAMQVLEVAAERSPWFCSGCPHNTSTKVPEGSRAMAGIGCHFMSLWMDRNTEGFTHMGGEGVPWVGQQAFCTDQHVFANIGDGTYFHSGSLAIRQSIAAGVNITYKILYNDAVAMTGGQPVGERPPPSGSLGASGHSVAQMAQSMRAEGASGIVVVTDEPYKYQNIRLVEGVAVRHRDELDAVQKEFRAIKGTSVIIYDQTCATEKRRRRKRGTMVDPARRVVINELVCEGCGDCSVQSNCLSVEPLETDFGRKRTINQSSCNKDMSCLKGFCPSFITVEGGALKKKEKQQTLSPQSLGAVPAPSLTPLFPDQVWGIVVAGVGGTGVITVGQLLGMAAHLEGKGIVTQDAGGLAQKGGAAWSHILISCDQGAIRTTRVGMAAADLIIACDPIVSASKETLVRMRAGRTHVALNAYGTPTAEFVKNGNWQNPAERCASDIAQAVGDAALASFDANACATRLMGDSIYTNPMLLGFAWQKGWIPLGLASLMRAIELNAVAVAKNKEAFEWGRQVAHQRAAVQALLMPAQIVQFQPRQSLTTVIARRHEFLISYQNLAYAQQYQVFVEKVRRAEEKLGSARTTLTEAVARNLFKLMAYKDEYEVARLHSDHGFQAKIKEMFEGDFKLNYHLAPPLISKRNDRGELQKRQFGPAMLLGFRLLAQLKGLRGSGLDIFGRTDERREERALIEQYRASLEEVLQTLSVGNLTQAMVIAQIPEQIKGFGHVKARHLKTARPAWDLALANFRNPKRQQQAA